MTVQSDIFVNTATTPKEDLGGGISRQILAYDDSLMLVKVYFEADSIGYRHEHVHAQVVYVESGVFDYSVGDETKRIVAGDSLYIPPNIQHGSNCIEAGVLLDMFSPVRKDFLKG